MKANEIRKLSAAELETKLSRYFLCEISRCLAGKEFDFVFVVHRYEGF